MRDDETARRRTVREPLALRGFRSYWLASTSGFTALAVSTVAVDVLVIDILAASEAQVGLVRAVQFLPYLLLGLLAGAYVDRWRRRPVLVVGHLVQAMLLTAIPVLFVIGGLTIGATAGILFAIGCSGVFIAAAEQSYLPDLVPRRALVLANARVGQSLTVAETSGPALGGALVGIVGAPMTLLISAAGRVVLAVMIGKVRRPEPAPRPDHPRLWRAIADGLRFTYRHRTLAPLAISTNIWFLANSISLTVLALFVLRGLGLAAVVYGLMLTAVGVGGLMGALCATRAAVRLGEGDVIIVARIVCALTWVMMALTPVHAESWGVVTYLIVVLGIYGFSMGAEEPSEMAFRQSATERSMLGRVNATMRSANRTAALLGAASGGVLVGVVGFRPTFAVVAVIFMVAVLVALLSPLRGARSR